MIAEIVLTAVLALGCGVGTPVHADRGVFGTLGCSCPDTPSGGPVQQHDIDRGIADGLSGSPPGSPR
ncbi:MULTISPECIES: hypothetical protein [unclassified Mycobacterium]|uniref:hypothetical protein n=1 Tax=unclassified Mycobacterium TaxID=2642494 RepID=UPI000A905480|nr:MULTISPECIES: hypothetical protein [unclassified Mycobacterium]